MHLNNNIWQVNLEHRTSGASILFFLKIACAKNKHVNNLSQQRFHNQFLISSQWPHFYFFFQRAIRSFECYNHKNSLLLFYLSCHLWKKSILNTFEFILISWFLNVSSKFLLNKQMIFFLIGIDISAIDQANFSYLSSYLFHVFLIAFSN